MVQQWKLLTQNNVPYNIMLFFFVCFFISFNWYKKYAQGIPGSDQFSGTLEPDKGTWDQASPDPRCPDLLLTVSPVPTIVGPMLRLGCLRKLCENCRKHLWFMVKDKMSQKIFKGAMINDISAIWSSYKMIAYVMIFVHNDRLRTVHDDIQTVKIDIQ